MEQNGRVKIEQKFSVLGERASRGWGQHFILCSKIYVECTKTRKRGWEAQLVIQRTLLTFFYLLSNNAVSSMCQWGCDVQNWSSFLYKDAPVGKKCRHAQARFDTFSMFALLLVVSLLERTVIQSSLTVSVITATWLTLTVNWTSFRPFTVSFSLISITVLVSFIAERDCCFVSPLSLHSNTFHGQTSSPGWVVLFPIFSPSPSWETTLPKPNK